MKKYIIGLGCSWTQGEGGYTEDIWQSHGGRVQVRGRDDYYLRKVEHENSWVNVLCRDHFDEYESVNLGIRGIGNTAAAHQLQFCDKVDWNNSTGVIIFMLSGLERFDLLGKDLFNVENQDDFYSKNIYKHYKYRTLWPFPMKEGMNKQIQDAYAFDLYTEPFVYLNSLLAILNAQHFAKAHNFHFVLANAFNNRGFYEGLGFKKEFERHLPHIVNKIDWSNYIHDHTDYYAFMQLLVRHDGLLEENNWTNFFDFYRVRKWPAKYLTNCEGAHPTLEGYKVIADELAKFLKQKNYV